MPTVELPSLRIRSPRTRPCRTSGGAVRKYSPLSSYVVSSSDVLAGEISTAPAPVILSMTDRETLDEAAPTTASTLFDNSRSTDWDAVSVEVSPESESTFSTCVPLTPPASLMSWRARSTPANSGGPRKASEPVCGSSVPILSVPSPLAAGAAELDVSSLGSAVVSSPSSPPQAVSTRPATPRTATDRQNGVGRIMNHLLLRVRGLRSQSRRQPHQGAPDPGNLPNLGV